MVTASIIKFIRVFPVPVTALSHTTETDINNIPVVTIRKTGIASSIKLLDSLKNDNNSPANTLNNTNIPMAAYKLSFMIR